MVLPYVVHYCEVGVDTAYSLSGSFIFSLSSKLVFFTFVLPRKAYIQTLMAWHEFNNILFFFSIEFQSYSGKPKAWA